MNKKYSTITFITIILILIVAVWFYRIHTVSQNNSFQSDTISTLNASSSTTSLTSPNDTKIIYYDHYNGYADPNEPATIFTIKDLKTGQESKIRFVIPVENIGRGIEQWYWIDNRYVLISGDALISILDTVQLKQVGNLIGYNPILSQDKKTLTYTEIEPPLYGPGSGKTKIKRMEIAEIAP